MLLKNQRQISPQRGMPTDDVGNSSKIVSVTGETVQLYYSNAGVRTADAGQAAGVAVQGQLEYENIKDSSGTMVGSKFDTSLSFTAGALTTEVSLDPSIIEDADHGTFSNKLEKITASLSNGQYVVDYVNGTIYGKKATTATTLANVAYKIQSAITVTTLVTGDVEIGAVEIKNSTDDTRATVGANGLYVDVRSAVLPTDAATETTLSTLNSSVGYMANAVLVDDTTTFSPGLTKALAFGGCVDDSATDSAHEGDMVVARFSARRAIMVTLDTRLDETNDAIRIYGSDDGGTTKRIIKTDSGGAIQVDVESGSVTADTELPNAVLLADNADVPTAPAVGAFGMYYDGSKFDMVRGDATNGALVNLGSNNDVDTELPAAVLLADNADVPTAPAVGAFNMVYDGSKFDMQRGDATDGTLVNLGTNNDVTVTSGSITETNSGSIKTAVEIMDDWDESDRAKVNPIVGQAGIAAGAGAVGVTVPRVTLASDDPAVTALQIIDDWDESDRAKVNIIVGQAGVAAGAGAVGVTVPRVTLASDDPAVTALEKLDNAADTTNNVLTVVQKPLAVTTYCWSVDQSAALEASSVAKGSAGVIRSIFGRIDSTAASGTYYIQFLNAASLPADGAVTHLATPYKIIHTTGTDSYFTVDFLEQGLFASSGIVVCGSSTEFTKTIIGSYLSMTVRYA